MASLLRQRLSIVSLSLCRNKSLPRTASLAYVNSFNVQRTLPGTSQLINHVFHIHPRFFHQSTLLAKQQENKTNESNGKEQENDENSESIPQLFLKVIF